jgi:hypothetical protein
VCLGLVWPGGTRTRTVELPPRSRVEVQQFAATLVLEYLRRRLSAEEVP